MSVQIVPTFDLPSWTEQTTLEGQTFTLYFDYSPREQTFYLSVADGGGVDIYNGMKLMPLQFLMRKCKDPRRPAGDFMVFDTFGDAASAPPGLHDLAPGEGRHVLHYFTSDLVTAVNTADAATLSAFFGALVSGAAAGNLSTYGQR